jgi:hypothetical protein
VRVAFSFLPSVSSLYVLILSLMDILTPFINSFLKAIDSPGRIPVTRVLFSLPGQQLLSHLRFPHGLTLFVAWCLSFPRLRFTENYHTR